VTFQTFSTVPERFMVVSGPKKVTNVHGMVMQETEHRNALKRLVDNVHIHASKTIAGVA